jgi:ubiquinol oxidase
MSPKHPELDRQRVHSAIAADYGRFASLGGLLRQTGHDERVHKLESLVGHDTARRNQTRTGLDGSAGRAA